ncbi:MULTISPECIES: hypothetical protein [Rhizobium/Agrobacterium group]|jgi:hypothetical protein|nr:MULTISPECIES: hypothetical protein [Rhizobium/Agrobacterium group]TCR93392.1 hypothetical protein EV561_101838 [Rhizobium sp. BK376]
MQVREWHIGLAVVVAAVAFYVALMVPMSGQAPQRGMQPPQHSAQK